MKRGNNKSKIIAVIIILILIIGVFLYFKFLKKENNPKTSLNQNNTLNETLQLSYESYEIKIQSYKFSPETLRIKAGDSVTWNNLDIVNHTITSNSGNVLDSYSFGKDDSFSFKFNVKGAYTYHCSLHERMQGTIIVE